VSHETWAKPEKSGDAKPPVLTVRKDSGAAMNTSKEDVMNTLISRIFLVLAALLPMSSLAQPFETGPAQPSASVFMPQAALPEAYKNVAGENQAAETLSVDQASSFGGGGNASLRRMVFRTNDLSVTNFRDNMLVKNDRASFTVNAPMPAVNGALGFAGIVSQAPLDSSLIKWVQVLSLVATRKINAELAYSAKINNYSRFDSAITYRMRPDAGSGESGVVASFKYSVSF
jgi:hypothetical protein